MNPFLAIATDHACLVKKAGVWDVGTMLKNRRSPQEKRMETVAPAFAQQALPRMRQISEQNASSGSPFVHPFSTPQGRQQIGEMARDFRVSPYRQGSFPAQMEFQNAMYAPAKMQTPEMRSYNAAVSLLEPDVAYNSSGQTPLQSAINSPAPAHPTLAKVQNLHRQGLLRP